MKSRQQLRHAARPRRRPLWMLATTLVVVGFLSDRMASGQDFGLETEALLRERSQELFGFGPPLDTSAPPSAVPLRHPTQPASAQVLLAGGLGGRYLTRAAADGTTAMVLVPAASPRFLLTCVDSPRALIGSFPGGRRKLNPSVQRIELATG
ncbi:MAG: hypothetical protein ACRD2T_10740, partial [Thermoanaerobaculia bacterium]